MKRWSEVSPYNGLEQEVTTNNASIGDIAMQPDAVKKKKKTLLDRSMMDARTKAYREHRARLEARRAKREEKKNKSKFIEKVKEEVASEMAYGAGYDTVKPMANIQPVNAAKSGTGYELYHKQFSGAMQQETNLQRVKGLKVQKNTQLF